MFRCVECGAVFEQPQYYRESRGEFWGTPCYEEYEGCPCCAGDFEEVGNEDDEDVEFDEELEG